MVGVNQNEMYLRIYISLHSLNFNASQFNWASLILENNVYGHLYTD